MDVGALANADDMSDAAPSASSSVKLKGLLSRAEFFVNDRFQGKVGDAQICALFTNVSYAHSAAYPHNNPNCYHFRYLLPCLPDGA